MNQFPGGNPFGGMQPQFPGSFPAPQGFGQFGNSGGFFGGNAGFPGANPFAGGAQFPSGGGFPGAGFPGTGFPPQGFPVTGFPPSSPGAFPQGGFGFPQGAGGFGGLQPPYAPFSQGPVPPPFGNENYFGSGNYGRPRSRHSSRHRSGSRRRHRRSSSSSSGDDRPEHGVFGGRVPPQYNNFQPFPNVAPLSPRGGSPVIPPRRPVW